MTTARKFEGFVLAGGAGSRMGGPKASLSLGGEAVVSRVVRAMSNQVTSISIVTDRPDEVAFLGLPTLPDIHKNSGPLGGLHSALASSSTPDILLVSCDLPFLSANLIAALIERHGPKPITVPRTSDGLHPLCAVYSRTLRQEVERHLDDRRLSMHDLIEASGALVVDVAGLHPSVLERELMNLNAPEDLEKARAILMN